MPKHEIISAEEAKALMEEFRIKYEHLPKIRVTDLAIAYLNPKIGDVVRISRNSATAGTAMYYRLVVEGEYVQPSEEER